MFGAAARSLIRQPSFTFAAAGTLALGIAASTALFSTVNAALLRPLPYLRSQEIYTARTFFPSGRFTIGLVASEEMAGVAQLRDVVTAVAMARRNDAAIQFETDSRQVVAYAVSDRFFDLFGVPVAAGRPIGGGDGAVGAPQVVVLSHALWVGAFGARPDVVGSTIIFADRPAKVIGIAPRGFDVPAGTELWLNTAVDPPGIGHAYEGYLRVRPGTSPTPLPARMDQTLAALGRKYPDQEVGRAYAIRPLLETTVGDLGPILMILFGATALLLILAAANVTNLLLARTTGRAREMAVRAALGASRRRILAQLIAESMLIAIVGGAAGAAAAYASVRLLLRFGAARLPRLADVSIDLHVLVFVAVLVTAIGLLVGLIPGLRLADTDLAALMNESGRSVRGSRKTRRLLGLFVIAEIAVAVAIVSGAGRLVRSYVNLESVSSGFDPRGRLVLDVFLPRADWTDVRRNAWWDASEQALRAAGATQVAAASSLPLEHEWDATTFVDLVSRPDVPPDQRPNARERVISAGFLTSMGIPLLRGRSFTTADRLNTQPVAIVNQAFVARNLGGADALGERVKGLHGHQVNGKFVPDDVVIVGVAADVKYSDLAGAPEPVLYVPFAQFFAIRASVIVTTADGAPERHLDQFVAALRTVEPRLPIDAVPMPAVVARSLERQRLGMWLMSGFGAAALALATVGMFGVIAYVVSQRTSELAVRQALGASRAQVFGSILAEGARAAVVGIALGLGIAWWIGHLIGRYVFDVSPRDPLVLVWSAAAVGVVALAATLLPAHRAATLELSRALRND